LVEVVHPIAGQFASVSKSYLLLARYLDTGFIVAEEQVGYLVEAVKSLIQEKEQELSDLKGLLSKVETFTYR